MVLTLATTGAEIQSTLMSWHALAVIVVLGGLAGCAKPDLPDLKVRAADASEFSSFKTDLERRFPKDRLDPFETALTELQWDAMHRDIKTLAERELDMLGRINGQTVRATEILGWRARRSRLQREIASMTGILEHNQKLAEITAATGTPESVTTHLHNAQDLLARLNRDLADTDDRLAEWSSTPRPAH